MPPPCLECARPVDRARPAGTYGKRGPRLIDGVIWCWFCSRQCSGVFAGKRNAARGLLHQNLMRAAEGRYRALNAKRQAHFLEESRTLQRYGVPRDLAVNLLDRVYQLGRKAGRDQAMGRLHRKVAA